MKTTITFVILAVGMILLMANAASNFDPARPDKSLSTKQGGLIQTMHADRALLKNF